MGKFNSKESFINKLTNDKDREKVARILRHSDSEAGVGQDIHSGNNKKKFIPKLVSSKEIKEQKYKEPSIKTTPTTAEYDEDHYLIANEPYYATLPFGKGNDKQNPYHNIIRDRNNKSDKTNIYEQIGDNNGYRQDIKAPPLPPKPPELVQRIKQLNDNPHMSDELPISTYEKQSFANKIKQHFKNLSNRLRWKRKNNENLYEKIPEVKQRKNKNRKFFNR